MDKSTATSSNFLLTAPAIVVGMAKRPHTRETLARNLDFLLKHFGYSERALEARCGVSAKTINNMRNGRHKATVDNTERVAAAFGLDGWQLIVPCDPKELLAGASLKKTLDAYNAADDEGREAIRRVAEREALYTTNKAS